MAQQRFELREVALPETKPSFRSMVGLLFKLAVIVILIWAIANLPDKPFLTAK